MGRSQPAAPNAAADLRRRAEKRSAQRSARKRRDSAEDSRRLLHELEVRQIELEIQNKELLSARQDVEAGLTRYTRMFDFAPIGYFVLAGDGIVREVNIAGARLLGEDRGRVVGRRFAIFLPEPERRAFADFLARVITGEPTQSRSCELGIAHDGSLLQARLTGAVLGGTPPAALLALEEVGARRAADATLRDEARRKDQFLAALSHELRNPLAALGSSLDVLDCADPGSEPGLKARGIMRRQHSHLTGLVDRMLDVTRIAQGKIELRLEPIELGEVVGKTVDDHRPSFEAGGVALSLRPAGAELRVLADPARVVQVLENLLGNALKFTSRGGKVEVGLKRHLMEAVVSVRDNGVGIAPEMLPHLFTAFTQASHTIDRAAGGLGLGLAMVKGLVELHRGTVEAGSGGAGAGSTFTVRLPLGEPGARVAYERQPSGAAEHPPRKRRLLIIDDNRDVARALQDVLRLDGHDVHVASDGPAGLALARELRPDVVLCDIGLPGMDGYAVAQALRKEAVLARTLLVALSGHGLPEDIQRALGAGFDRYVAKPPTLQTLERVIAETR
jgi:two-component system CheB/CheR fusion protein